MKKMSMPIIKADDDISFLHDGEWKEARDLGEPFSDGEIVLFFANLHNNGLLVKQIEAVFSNFDAEISVESYFSSCLESLESVVPSKFIELFIMGEVNEYIEKKSRKKVPAVAKKAISGYKMLASLGNAFAEALDGMTDSDESRFRYGMIFKFMGNFQGDIRYGLFPVFKDDKLVLLDVYDVTTGFSALMFDYANAFKNKVVIKRCDNCGKFFIPASRSDEKYCDNLNENGRTCKQMGYENKIKADSVVQTYRTVYKTQNARKQRNKKNITDLNGKFGKWRDYAHGQMLLCQAGDIDMDTYKERISSDSWMFE